MPKNKNCSVDYCIECIQNMTILCPWCKNPIFIGNPITLYSPGQREYLFFSSKGISAAEELRTSDKEFVIPDGAVVYSENPLILVGCLGWNCADTGGDRAGFWLPGGDGSGYVYRVPTAFETLANVGVAV